MIDPTAQAFPRIDECRFGRPHRYAYAVAVRADGNTQLVGATQIYKHDLATGERRVHDFGADRVPGEFVFVPARPEAGEDERWLVGLVIDTARDTTDFTILDARVRDTARRHGPSRAPDPAGLPRELVSE